MINHHSLLIKARFCPEIVERILRVIRHRGFTLTAMNMSQNHICSNHYIQLSLIVSSQRSINLLHSQLNKLTDIKYVKIQEQY